MEPTQGESNFPKMKQVIVGNTIILTDTKIELIRQVIDTHNGVFSFSNQMNLFCNACRVELDHVPAMVNAHLNDDNHQTAYKQMLTRFYLEHQKQEANRSAMAKLHDRMLLERHLGSLKFVISTPPVPKHLCPIDTFVAAFNQEILIPTKDNLVRCNVCENEYHDSIVMLRAHLASNVHLFHANRNNSSYEGPIQNFSLIYQNLGESLTQLMIENKDDLQWLQNREIFCKLCNRTLLASSRSSIERHLASDVHTNKLGLKPAIVASNDGNNNPAEGDKIQNDDQFNTDLAEMMEDNQIPLDAIEGMRGFLSKYTDRDIPDVTTLERVHKPQPIGLIDHNNNNVASDEEEEEIEVIELEENIPYVDETFQMETIENKKRYNMNVALEKPRKKSRNALDSGIFDDFSDSENIENIPRF